MHHNEVLNALIRHFGYHSYLEIGSGGRGANFDRVNCPEKLSVDPDPTCLADRIQSSDEFFATNDRTFDLVFIDGLHHAGQVYRDIVNSLACLNPNGSIVCHDLSPRSELEQRVPRDSQSWTGDCWKAWVRVRLLFDNLEMFVVDTDHGCGIIRRGGKSTPLLTWDTFDTLRQLWLNLVSVEEF